jgi:hypothetical protein
MLYVYFHNGSIETHKVGLDTWIEYEAMSIWLLYSADRINQIKHHLFVISSE